MALKWSVWSALHEAGLFGLFIDGEVGDLVIGSEMPSILFRRLKEALRPYSKPPVKQEDKDEKGKQAINEEPTDQAHESIQVDSQEQISLVELVRGLNRFFFVCVSLDPR